MDKRLFWWNSDASACVSFANRNRSRAIKIILRLVKACPGQRSDTSLSLQYQDRELHFYQKRTCSKGSKQALLDSTTKQSEPSNSACASPNRRVSFLVSSPILSLCCPFYWQYECIDRQDRSWKPRILKSTITAPQLQQESKEYSGLLLCFGY